MEPKFRKSFIPKQTLQTSGSRRSSSGAKPFGIITLIALILALGAIVLSVGAFLYQQLLEGGITRKGETLERAREAFEPALIEELVRVDERLENAEDILASHVALSAFFEELEDRTLKSVRFEDFNLTRVSDDRINISMRGVADDFNGIALQADIFGKSKVIREPIFSNLNINQEGRAVFQMTAFVDQSSTSFTSQVDSGAFQRSIQGVEAEGSSN